MSDTFREIMLKGQSVSSNINIVFLVTVIFCSVLSFKMKSLGKAFFINTALVIAAIILASNIFENWWASLKAVAVNIEDQTWIADRDGGLIIIHLSILFKAFGVWLVALAVSILMNRKRKKAC